MTLSELEYLIFCKKKIESRLGWQESSKWKQRDYLSLIELIENKTKINLSLSTIKRIWDVNYEGTPHPSTLDAFAQFLDYDNWLHFKEQNQQSVNESKNGKVKRSPFLNNIFSRPFIVLILAVFIIGTGVVSYQFLIVENPLETLNFNADDINFSCRNSVATGVPNTIIFDYDVSKVNTDSFFIQQKWNINTRYKIDKNEKQYTTVYYIPGFHKAKLVANDSIIKEINVKINTPEWVALIRKSYYDNAPIFITNKNLISNGVLHASEELLKSNKVNIDNQTLTSYFYINEFNKPISSGDFEFETRLKCDSIYNFTCPYISIMIVGEGNGYFLPLLPKGCIGDASLKIGNVYISGKTNDLSAFGVNVFSWQKLKLRVKDKKATIFINDNPVYEVNFDEDVGKIAGFSLHFPGTGVVDYVKLWDSGRKLVYYEEF